MPEPAAIADQLARACTGNAWHGPSVLELLDDLTPQQAAWISIPSAHTIWEIVLHLTAWHDAVRERMAGDPVNLSGEADWPTMPVATEEHWTAARDAFVASYHSLRVAIEAFPAERLATPVPGKPFTYYTMLHGTVQHDLYHAGQIALLKKFL